MPLHILTAVTADQILLVLPDTYQHIKAAGTQVIDLGIAFARIMYVNVGL